MDIYIIIIAICVFAILLILTNAVTKFTKRKKSSKLLPSKKKTELSRYDSDDSETRLNMGKNLWKKFYK